VENILVIGNKEFQKQAVLSLGIPEDKYCNCKETDAERWISERTGGVGVDIFFECVGKNETVTQAVNSTIPGGKIMLVGNPYSDMKLEKAVYWKILRHQLLVTGTWNSSFVFPEDMQVAQTDFAKEDDWRYVLKLLEEKRIAPTKLITHKYTLEDLEKGFHVMRDKSEDYVKVMGFFSKCWCVNGGNCGKDK